MTVTATQDSSHGKSQVRSSISNNEQKSPTSPRIVTKTDLLKDSPSLVSATSVNDSSDEDPTKRRRRPVLESSTPQLETNPNRHGRIIASRPKGLSEFDDNDTEPESAHNEYASGNIGFRTRRLSKLVPDTLSQSTKPGLVSFKESESQDIQDKIEFASGFRQRGAESGKRLSVRPQPEGSSQSKLQPLSNEGLNQVDKREETSKYVVRGIYLVQCAHTNWC
jgi:hypothetical protein